MGMRNKDYYRLPAGQTKAGAVKPRCLKLGLLVLTTVFLFLISVSSAAAAQTYVSLTFDDGRTSQQNAGAILAAHGVHGTFYIISGDLGTSNYFMTLDQVRALAAAGNEIGGHTLTHDDLTADTPSQVISQVCGNQQQLQDWGFPAVSFAYPYGRTNANVEAIVQNCKLQGYDVKANYRSARGAWGLQCPGCDAAESLPPLDPFALRTTDSPQNTTTLSDLESMVTKAEATGGWLVIPFHSVCSAPGTAPVPGNGADCTDSYSVTYSNLDQFVDWLSKRADRGTSIKTVGEVMNLTKNPQKPSLKLSQTRVYWASYPDYQIGNLSVDFSLSNSGAGDANFLEAIGANSSNGVDTSTAMPLSLGMLPSGSSRSFTLKYTVPAQVTVFRTSIYVTAEDGSGTAYAYPGPYPGA